MRALTLAFAVIVTAVTAGQSAAQTSQTATSTYQERYVCPKCGKTHIRTVSRPQAVSTARVEVRKPPVETAASQSTTQVRSGVPSQSVSLRATGGVSNVMAALNAQRSRRGVGALLYDSRLQAVAERRARQMAASGSKNHPPGSFAPGRYEGVGWSSSYSPSGVSACFTSDSRMRYAGAAMATGRDGVYFAVVYR